MTQGRHHVGSSMNIIRQVRAEMNVTICGSTQKTGMHFLHSIAALTKGLLQMGLKEGDVVAIAALNSDLYLEWMMAVMCAGCIVAPLNYRWSPEEALLAAGQVCPVMVVVDSFCLEWSRRFTKKIPSLRFQVLLGGQEDPTNNHLISAESIGQYAGGFQDLDFHWAPDSVALICFTSGTTEKPKGVAITHEALIVQSQAKITIVGYTHSDVYLHTSPLCHIGGISSALAIVLVGGCHIFIPKFEAASALLAIQRYSVSAMITVPTMLADIVAFCINSRSKKGESTPYFPSLEKMLNGAGSLSQQLIKKVAEFFPRAQIFSAYGMTEACSSITFTLAHHPIIRQGTSTKLQEYSMNQANQNNFQDHRVGICVGKPAPHVEIQIEESDEYLVDNNSSNVGIILTRGPHVMLKYWSQNDSTTTALSENGWLNTGDLGWIDEDCRLWLLGRSKDMIKSGGENVYPSEVENILLQHPGILAAVVIGIPDPRFIEIVTACVRLRDGWHWEHQNFAVQNHVVMNEQKKLSPLLLRLFCKQQGLSGFKSPRIFFPRKEPFPTTTTGKVKRDALKREIFLRLQPCSDLTAAKSSL